MKSNYVMECIEEVDRLEAQSKLTNYSLDAELQYLDFKKYKNVLDAGCGSGLLGRHLQIVAPHLDYIGCDNSDMRLDGARELSPELKFSNIDLLNLNDIKKIPTPDLILNRYVLHHVSDPLPLLKNFFATLTQGGSCYLVDIEGLLINLGTTDTFLQSCIRSIHQNFYGNLDAARFLPSYLSSVGFKNIQWRVQTMDFQGKDREDEIVQFQDRFRFAEEHLTQYLGDSFTYKKFIKHFFEEMKKPEVCLYYNKIITWGDKL